MLSEKNQVEIVVQEYIRGTYKGDAELLNKVFHSRAQMTGLIDGQLIYATPQLFIDDIASKTSIESSGNLYETEITHLEVSGDTASATLIERGLMGMIFTNYFHFLREDSSWKIVSKNFSGVVE